MLAGGKIVEDDVRALAARQNPLQALHFRQTGKTPNFTLWESF
jgi:hypothetical protein